jgi:hypothetical protein
MHKIQCIVGCFSLHMFFNIFNSDQLYLCMHVNIHKNQRLDLKCKNSSLAINFNFIKEIQKLYKGKYLIRAIVLSFFTGKSNQLTVLTRLLHFHCFLDRHPYWPYIKRYGHNAIWPGIWTISVSIKKAILSFV